MIWQANVHVPVDFLLFTNESIRAPVIDVLEGVDNITTLMSSSHGLLEVISVALSLTVCFLPLRT